MHITQNMAGDRRTAKQNGGKTMRGKETLWKQIRTLWTVLLLAVLFVGAVQVKAEETSEEVATQEETQVPTITITPYIDGKEYTGEYLPLDIGSEHTLSVQVAVSDGSTPIYEWRDNDGNLIENADSNIVTMTKGIGYEYYYVYVETENGGFASYSFPLAPEETMTVTQWIDDAQTSWEFCGVGDKLTLKVEADSTYQDGDVTYQWYDTDLEHPINGAVQAEYTVQKQNKGRETYCCEISDGNYSFPAFFTISLENTLSVAQYVDGSPYYEFTTIECETGTTCQLEVRVKSSLESAAITYRWSYAGPDGMYHDLEGDAATYDFPVKEGEWQVNCYVDDGNEGMTYFFRLRTANSLSGTQYMNGKKESYGTFAKGDSIKMEVKASSSLSNTLTYQWYQGDWCDDSTKMDGEKESILDIVKGQDTERQYICKVSDGIFTREYRFYINSINTLRLTAYINDDIDNDDKYYFSQGEEVTLKIVADSSYDKAELKYRWYQETEEGTIELKTEEKTPDVCKVTKGKGTDSYECVVSDGNTEGVYYFNLYEETDNETFICIPYIDGVRYDNGSDEEQYIYKDDCTIGQTLTLRAEVLAGGEDVSRQWEIYDEQNGWTTLLGKTGETLVVKIENSNNVQYRCLITCGNKTGKLSYDLDVRGEEEPGDDGELRVIPYVNGKWSSEIKGKVGDEMKVSLEVINAPEHITYQWYKTDIDTSNVVIKGATDREYIYTMQEDISGISCVIYSEGKQLYSMMFDTRIIEDESQSTLTVKDYTINDQTTDFLKCKPGQEVTLKVDAVSTTGNTISYTWYRNGGVKLGTGNSYTFNQQEYQNIYCLISDGVSNIYQWFELDMDYYDWSVSQYIDGEETDKAICKVGAPVKMEIRAEGEKADILTIRWFDDKNKLLGQGAVLSVNAEAKEKIYKCKVSDGYQTEEYWFSLKPEGSILTIPYINGEKAEEITLDVGETAELKVNTSGVADGVTYQWYVSKDYAGYRALGTSAVQKIIGDNSGASYLCVVRAGAMEEKVYFDVYHEGDAGEHVHVWNAGVITKEPTQTETGIKIYTCLTCGERRQEVLDKLPPTTEDTKPSNPTTETKPSTQPSQPSSPAQKPQTQAPSAPASNPAPAVGTTLVSSDKKAVYKITGSNTVEYTKAASNKAKVTIPSTVTYQGRKYQVTSIGAKAFRNSKKLKKVVIPSTVRKIGKQAFANCKKLKSITIKTNKLSAKTIGNKAFKGINAKATIKVPKKKLKLYKKILRAKGVSASAKIK